MTFSCSSRPHPSLRNRFSRRVEWVFRRRMDQSGVQYGEAGSVNENEGRLFVIICEVLGLPRAELCTHHTSLPSTQAVAYPSNATNSELCRGGTTTTTLKQENGIH